MIMIANIHDRAGIETIYPEEVFAFEAGENSRATTTVHKGVRILSEVDGNGNFEIERASRQVGEAGGPDQAIFLSPDLVSSADALVAGGGYGTTIQRERGRLAHKAVDYVAFIDRIIEAAKQAEIRPAPRGDERLRGPRQ
jgi:hypothetical protein